MLDLPGARITGGYKLPEVGTKHMSFAFFTAGPSLQPCGAYVLLMVRVSVTVIKDITLIVSAGKKNKAGIWNDGNLEGWSRKPVEKRLTEMKEGIIFGMCMFSMSKDSKRLCV